MKRPITRRSLLTLMATTPLLAVERGYAAAGAPPLIADLIEKAKPLPHISQRIDVIGRALLGARYASNTLIGGPNRPEQFVVRTDAFDCVTFCEVVLTAAMARDVAEFETALRRIRYNQGIVAWKERNHYFADWNERNIENRICQPVAMQPSISIRKTVTWHRALGKHTVSIAAIPRSTLLANTNLLAAGDIIGFTSRRADLDFFHTGLITLADKGRVMLRHASKSRGRVIDQDMAAFCTANNVQYVTLVRARENAPPASAQN